MLQTKTYKYILFDLDGTLTDSIPGILNSFRYSLDKLNIKFDQSDKLKNSIGAPLKQIFMDIWGIDSGDVETAIKFYREYFTTTGIYENTLYKGITDLLVNLVTKNKILAIATSKPTPYTKIILTHFGIIEFFDFISGSDLEGKHVDKYTIINNAIKNLEITDFADVVMVGDTNFDIIGANKIGIDSIAVLYGYGSVKSIDIEKPTYKVCSVDELGRIVLY